jgi:hypothetical protein
VETEHYMTQTVNAAAPPSDLYHFLFEQDIALGELLPIPTDGDNGFLPRRVSDIPASPYWV